MRIDPHLVQMNVLRSVDPLFTLYVFFRIHDAAGFRSFLTSALAQDLSFAETKTGLYSERDRVHHQSRAAEVPTSTGAPRHAGLLHVNVGFTLSGLASLGIAKETCDSFPEPFRQGMGARATLLGDTGASAPDRWEGYLGSPDVHGVLWWNWWNVVLKHDRLPGPARNQLEERADRAWQHVKETLPRNGIEILHTETGAAHYRCFPTGDIDRIEHFGFRDGISQPWVDFGVSDARGLSRPPPGGGTPSRDGQWSALAPGEFVLGYPDEDGLTQEWPGNQVLRHGGIYMVFRKLEQDVVAFRNFLHRAAPDPEASSLLAAQMFGRWPDGTPLVQSPCSSNPTNQRDPVRSINDFLYERDDPGGTRCPIGAHIRRSNPRDTGGRNGARRHRLLRRGITYGPMLPEQSPGDGCRRGMLFVALNARIDQQFELVQSRWLNAGELIGQVGAGRDPILAAHEGRLSDSFWSPSRPAPVTHLPRFVTMRGGDYFFVPGLPALRKLAAGDSFPADPDPKSLRAAAIGTINTPEPRTLFYPGPAKPTPDELEPFDAKVLRDFIAAPGAAPRDYTIAFVARHGNVLKVLRDEQSFSVKPYSDAIAQIANGENMIVGMQSIDPERKERIKLWKAAEDAYQGPAVEDIIDAAAAGIIARCAPAGRLDVAQDFGLIVPLVLIQRYYGVPGPDWLSPTAVAATFNKQEITGVPPSWLQLSTPVRPQDVPFATLHAWTRFAFAQVFVNVVRASELTELAKRTTAEMFDHLDQLIVKAHLLRPDRGTLLACLVDQVKQSDNLEQFNTRIRLTLAERMVGGTDTIGKAIVNVVNHLLQYPDRMKQAREAARKLHGLQAARQSSDDDLKRIDARRQFDAVLRECLRFDPVAPIIFRACERDTMIGGNKIRKKSLVCLLAGAAMNDAEVFAEPQQFRLDRLSEHYLVFGAGLHQCAGQCTAETVLRIALKRLLLLNDLRRAAGPAGQIRYMADTGLPDSMVVRFGP